MKHLPLPKGAYLYKTFRGHLDIPPKDPIWREGFQVLASIGNKLSDVWWRGTGRTTV